MKRWAEFFLLFNMTLLQVRRPRHGRPPRWTSAGAKIAAARAVVAEIRDINRPGRSRGSGISRLPCAAHVLAHLPDGNVEHRRIRDLDPTRRLVAAAEHEDQRERIRARCASRGRCRPAPARRALASRSRRSSAPAPPPGKPTCGAESGNHGPRAARRLSRRPRAGADAPCGSPDTADPRTPREPHRRHRVAGASNRQRRRGRRRRVRADT